MAGGGAPDVLACSTATNSYEYHAGSFLNKQTTVITVNTLNRAVNSQRG